MLLKNETLEAIKNNLITVVFRIWKRPTVKKGGTLTTRVGVLFIDDIKKISQMEISKKDLAKAGVDSFEDLGLSEREGNLYKITLHYHGEDPRIALRNNVEPEELEVVCDKLKKMGDWTKKYLELIDQNPNIHAQILADKVGLEKKQFKPKVRRLKALGLTESLRPGYRLSKRGETVVRML